MKPKKYTITVRDAEGLPLLSIAVRGGEGPGYPNVWTRPAGADGAKKALRVLTRIADPDRPERRKLAQEVQHALKDENDFLPLIEAAGKLAKLDS